ncbi:dipeptide ABC transporter ATP-binding protein [Nocardiopsis coralliicola]
MTSGALLDVEDLSVLFTRRGRPGITAVDRVSFTLAEGRIGGLVGESGCGKSVTALALMGLLPARGVRVSGAARFAARAGAVDLPSLPQRALRDLRGREIAMVFQDPLSSLNPVVPIGRQVTEIITRHRGLRGAAARNRAAELLDRAGIPDPQRRLSEYPHELSGGMRQRALIAMAVACRPRLLIADEPTTALDVTIQAQILELLAELVAEEGTALLMITHDLGVVAGLCDDVTVLYAGKAVEAAPRYELFAEPAHPYTGGLLGSIPRLDAPRDEPLTPIRGTVNDAIAWDDGCAFAPRCDRAADDCLGRAPAMRAARPGHRHRCVRPLRGAHSGPVLLNGSRTGPSAGTRRGTGERGAGSSGGAAPPAPRSAGEPAASTGTAPGAESGARSAAGAAVPGRPLLEVAGAAVHFPIRSGILVERTVGHVRAVDGVSLSIAAGTTYGLVGESGCGKTTLGRAVLRLTALTAGSVLLDGTDLAGLSGEELRRERRRLQMVFQDPLGSLDPRQSVASLLAEGLEVHGIGAGRADRHRRAAEALEAVGLPAAALSRYPHEFSGGQRQRLGIARALVLAPDLIICDEPVSALDVSVQAQVLNLLAELQRERGLTYLVIAHDLAVVRHVSDTVGVMYLGGLVEEAPSDTLYRAPLHPYTRSLISAVPVPDPAVEDTRTRVLIEGDLPSPAAPVPGCRFHTRCPWRQDDRCATERPALRTLATGHRVACHFAEQIAGGTVRPAAAGR